MCVPGWVQDPRKLVQRYGGKPPLTMKAFEKLVDAGEGTLAGDAEGVGWFEGQEGKRGREGP